MKIHSQYRLKNAVSIDVERPTIQGVHITPDGQRAVATDGRIMAVVPIETDETDTKGCIIPADALDGAQKLAKGAMAHIELNGAVKYQSKAGEVSAPYLPGTYPNWTQVIPPMKDAEQTVQVILDVDLLYKLACALKDDGTRLNRKARVVRLIIDKEDSLNRIVRVEAGGAYGFIMPCRE